MEVSLLPCVHKAEELVKLWVNTIEPHNPPPPVSRIVHLFSTVLNINRTELHFYGTIECVSAKLRLISDDAEIREEEGIFHR
jgi:hypothetical protein